MFNGYLRCCRFAARGSRWRFWPAGCLKNAGRRISLAVKQHNGIAETEPQAPQGMAGLLVTESDDPGNELNTVEVRRIHATDYTA